MGDFTAALLVRALWIAVENPAPYFSEFGTLNGYGVSKFAASVCQDNWEQTAILFVPKGLSQILCKHRNAVQIEQNLFKAEVAQAAAALFSK